jgi:DNA helicase IV
MAERLRAAVERRLDPPEQELGAFVQGSFVRVRPEDVAELVQEAWRESGSLAAGAERLRMKVLRRFYERYGRVLGGQATMSFEEIERALRKAGTLQRFLKAVWPKASPEELVREVLTELGAKPKRGEWSDADLPLLDEARALVHGQSETYGHVLVDEAQDLTPMQLRMIARRAPTGSLTILGDIAQATGPIAYGSWDELLAHLPHGAAAEVAELRYAYRVPRQIMELALPLLARIAPDAAPPEAYREGEDEPLLVATEPGSLVETALAEVARLAPLEGSVALIVPASLRASVPDVPDLSILTPPEAKGLEFDRVVVVEPALVVEEGEELRGLRELYVALTRPTKSLVLVHSRGLPEPL